MVQVWSCIPSEDLPQAFAAISLPNDRDLNVYANTRETNHMISDVGMLYFISSYSGNAKVHTRDRNPLSITHIWSMCIGLIELNKVPIVLELKENLLFVIKFIEKKNYVFWMMRILAFW